MPGLRISVHGSVQLQSQLLRLKGMDRALASQINKQTRNVAEPVWKEAVAANATSRLETRVLANTARVSVTRANVTLRAGAIGRALSGGAKPPDLVHAAEFGADRNATRKTVRGNLRHTRRQFRPRNRKGYVVYPAAADVIPRIASLWVQTTVRTFHEAIEGS